MPEATTALNSKGVGYTYYQLMEKNQHQIAQVDGLTGEEQTYGELLQRSIGAAVAMESEGLKPGDFISICSLNHLDVGVPYLASLFTGAICAAVEPTMLAQEVVHLLNQVEPKIIFVGREAVETIRKAVEDLTTKPLVVVFGKSGKYPSFSEFIARPTKGFAPRVPVDVNETALVLFSSGTTGRPKAICHSHKSMLADYEYIIGKSFSSIAGFATPYWVSYHAIQHMCIIHGLRKIVYPRFDVSNPWRIFDFKIDLVMVNPLQALSFLAHEPPDGVDFQNLKYMAFGGNDISKEQILRLRSRFPLTKVVNMYGQTELFGGPFLYPFHTNSWDLTIKYPTCVGIIKDTVSWKVVDIETGQTLGPNQQGELLLKTERQFKGYHNRDSSDAFDHEGWLRTGDLFYYNEEMCFFVVNRMKESFKFQAHHIIPSEIEHVLLSHPAIAKAVVLGLPHETENNHPMAVIQLHPKGPRVSEEEIVRYVEQRVADKNRLRAGVKFVRAIPLTVTDKVNRFKLREMIINCSI
ncbi:4-coumarate--CoA ligase 1-like [Photinus pyralis]|uniref:Luciferin 4-monooxygenase n=1 Tax=Photinus pyralis TaxID=7054 RepID=A0A1Y1KDR9_PHOPY|nr:4-coumarate--CoA ligase 1-like [Photinus pyralis]